MRFLLLKMIECRFDGPWCRFLKLLKGVTFGASMGCFSCKMIQNPRVLVRLTTLPLSVFKCFAPVCGAGIRICNYLSFFFLHGIYLNLLYHVQPFCF